MGERAAAANALLEKEQEEQESAGIQGLTIPSVGFGRRRVVRRRLTLPFSRLHDSITSTCTENSEKERAIPCPVDQQQHAVESAVHDVVDLQSRLLERLESMDSIRIAFSLGFQVMWCAIGYNLYRRYVARKRAAQRDELL